MIPSPAPVMASFELMDPSVHTFSSTLQGVVTAGVGKALPYPSSKISVGIVTALLMLQLCFALGLAGDDYLATI